MPARLGLLGLVALAPACERPCIGVGCAEDFAVALVTVQQGGPALRGADRSPLDAWAGVEGTIALGPDWALLAGDGVLLAGVPAEGAVRAFRLADGRWAAADGAEGTLRDSAATGAFGAAIDRLADIDGDGLDELIVGAPEAAASADGRREGRVDVVSGGVGGFGVAEPAAERGLVSLRGAGVGDGLGGVVAGCGDLDGDAIPDVAVAGPLADGALPLVGRVVVLSGAARGVVDAAALRHSWSGVSVGERAGAALACRHDLTGDGVADLVVGAPFADGVQEAEGALYLLPGGALPVAGALSLRARLLRPGLGAQFWFGWSVATGDLDGDGRAELVAGAPGAFDGRGLVLVWPGADAADPATALAPIRLFGEQAGDGFGSTVAIADLDGDAFGDLIIGAPRRNPSPEAAAQSFDAGALYVFAGAAGLASFRPTLDAGAADTILEDPQQYLRTGRRVATGDLDGDGIAELALLHRSSP